MPPAAGLCTIEPKLISQAPRAFASYEQHCGSATRHHPGEAIDPGMKMFY